MALLHMMSDTDGQFPLTSLNEWERAVVRVELRRPNARGWYRNPSRPPSTRSASPTATWPTGTGGLCTLTSCSFTRWAEGGGVDR